MNKRTISRRSAAALAAAVGVISVTQAQAQITPEVVWDGGGTPGSTGSWVVATNWNPDVVPSNTDVNSGNDPIVDLQFVQINDGGTATIAGSDAAEAPFLALGLKPGDTGHLDISGGQLVVGEMRVGGRESINDNLADWSTPGTYTPNGGGTGTVLQTGGDVYVTFSGIIFDPDGAGPDDPKPIQSLYIGDAGLAANNTANGTWEIQGGLLKVGEAVDDAIVIGTGAGTVGTFIQSGGTVTTTGFMTIGRRGASASYTMSGGTLNVGQGAPVAGQNLRIGEGEYPTGNLTPGTVGTFTQTNGAVLVNQEVSVGRQTGTGTYNISGSGSSLNANSMNLGAGGTGSMTMGTIGGSGPTIDLRQSMSVGISAGTTIGTGTMVMNSGTLAVGTSGAGTRVIAIGNEINGKGTFTQEGGTLSSTDLLQIGRNNSNQDNLYTLKGGSVTAQRWFVGGGNGATGGKGTFDLQGGTATVGENLNIGVGGTGSTSNGTVTISGGTLTMTAAAAIVAVGNGQGTTGSWTQSGGTVNATGATAVIDVGRSNANTTFTMTNGVLNTTQLRMADRTGTSFTPTRIIDLNGGSGTIGTLGSGQWSGNTLNINGGTHTINTLSMGTTSTINVNMNLNVNAVNHGTMTFNVAPGMTLTTNTATTATVPRTITKAGAGTYTINGAQTHFAGTVLKVAAGTVNENSSPNGQHITTEGGTANINAASSTIGNVTATTGTVNFNGALATVGNLNVNGGTSNITNNATAKIVVANTVGVNTGGGAELDVHDNAMMLTGDTVPNVRSLLLAGSGGAGFGAQTWNAPGINSSFAATDPLTYSVGYMDNDNFILGAKGTFEGQTVPPGAELVKATLAGDADLDWDVDDDDVTVLGIFYGGPGHWYEADFDYTGFVDDDDVTIMGITYGQSLPGAPAGVSAVPEPASLGLLGLAATGLLRRRRRQ